MYFLYVKLVVGTLALTLLASVLLRAQGMTYNYTNASTVQTVDNIPNCVVGQYNCWHELSGGVVEAISAGQAFIAGLSGGCVWFYADYPADTWTQQTQLGCGWTQIAVGDANNIWLISSSPNSTGGNVSQVIATQNSNGGVTYSGTTPNDGVATTIGVGGDGTVWVTNSSQNVYSWSGTEWEIEPGALSQISVANASDICGVNSSGVAWVYSASSDEWSELPTISAGFSQCGIDPNGVVYVLGKNGYVYHYNGSGWDQLTGSGMTHVTNGGQMFVFAVGAQVGNSNINRFSDTGIQQVQTLSGNATCSGDCTGVIHTGTVQAAWVGTYTGGAKVQQAVAPTDEINVSSNATLIDAFDCLESDDQQYCQWANIGSVVCSVAGLVYNASPSMGKYEWAHGSGQVTAVDRNKIPDTPFYGYSMIDNCDPVGSGDVDMGVNIDQTSPQMLDYLRTDEQVNYVALCYSPDGFQPFVCSNGGAVSPVTILERFTTYQGLYSGCTTN